MQLVLLTLLALAAAGPALTGTKDLPGGRRLTFSYDFDRNAIADSVEVNGRFVVLTRSGDLVLFAEGGRALRSRTMSSRGRCLARGRSGVLVGFEDGTIAQVDLATMQPVVQARFPAPVLLVGETARGQMVAVTERSYPTRAGQTPDARDHLRGPRCREQHHDGYSPSPLIAVCRSPRSGVARNQQRRMGRWRRGGVAEHWSHA